MSPYRTPPPSPVESSPGDDELIYGLLVVLGAIRVAIAILAGQGFGFEATVALLLMCLGAVGLLRTWRLHLTIRRGRGPTDGRTCGR